MVERIEHLRGAKKTHAGPASKPAEGSQAGVMETIRVPAEVVKALDIQTSKVAVPSKSRSLLMSGSLAHDTNRLAHVHTRFSGEVVELGTVDDPSAGSDGGKPVTRVLRFGDIVEKGQLLAVLWSDDLGEKKRE